MLLQMAAAAAAGAGADAKATKKEKTAMTTDTAAFLPVCWQSATRRRSPFASLIRRQVPAWSSTRARRCTY